MPDDEKGYSIATVGDKWYAANADKLKEILGVSELKGYIDEHIKEIHTRSHNQANKIEDKISELEMDNKLKFNIIENHSTILADMKERLDKLEKEAST